MREALDKMIIVDENDGDRRKQYAKQTKDSIMICTLAPDLIQFANTKWGFLNAVADYTCHSKPLRNTKYWKENRWGSIIAGNGLMDAAMRVVSA